MVSSEEFLQQLQAGQIGEALALAMSETLELDVTTRLANDSVEPTLREGGDATLEDVQVKNSGEFLRTKINFLTGEIHNEVSQELAMNGKYLQLQQFHIEQMNASHRIVQAHFQQIQELLKSWQQFPVQPPHRGNVSVDVPVSDSISTDEIESDRLSLGTEDVDELLAIASEPLDFSSITEPESWLIPDDPGRSISEDKDEDFSFGSTVELATSATNLENDVNLYLDRDDEEWGEWVENDDLLQEPIINYSPTNNHSPSAIPDWEEHWLQQHSVNLPEPKPPISRMPIERPEAYDSLEKFAPEYVGFSANTQPDGSGDLSQPIWRKDIDDLIPIEDLFNN